MFDLGWQDLRHAGAHQPPLEHEFSNGLAQFQDAMRCVRFDVHQTNAGTQIKDVRIDLAPRCLHRFIWQAGDQDGPANHRHAQARGFRRQGAQHLQDRHRIEVILGQGHARHVTVLMHGHQAGFAVKGRLEGASIAAIRFDVRDWQSGRHLEPGDLNAPHRSENARKIGFDPDKPMRPVWTADPTGGSGGPSVVLQLKHELFRLPSQNWHCTWDARLE